MVLISYPDGNEEPHNLFINHVLPDFSTPAIPTILVNVFI